NTFAARDSTFASHPGGRDDVSTATWKCELHAGIARNMVRNIRHGRSCRSTKSIVITVYSPGLLCCLGISRLRVRADEFDRTAGCGKSARPVGGGGAGWDAM